MDDPFKIQSSSSDADPDIPSTLQRDLRATFRSKDPFTIPVEIDEHVSRAARGHIAANAGNIRKRWRLRPSISVRVAASSSAAAALVMAVLLLQPTRPPTLTPSSALATALPGDIDGNGRIDIVDALVLSNRITKARTLDPDWDLNADGAVDHQDALSIRARIVKLDGGAL